MEKEEVLDKLKRRIKKGGMEQLELK